MRLKLQRKQSKKKDLFIFLFKKTNVMPEHSKHALTGNEIHELDEFDFATQLLEYGYYLVLGKRRSGKTTMARLVSQHTARHKTAQHVVIAGNENIKEQWAEIVHPIYIHDGFSIDGKTKDASSDVAIAALDQIIKEQQRRVRECSILKVPFPEEWKVILFIDDCGTMKKFMHSPQMKWLASNGRQIKTDIFIIIQKLTHACTESREGADGVMCLQTAHAATIKSLHGEFLSTIPIKLFQTVLAGATQNRGMLIINAHPLQHHIRQMLFFSHADFLHPDGFEGKLEHVASEVHWEYARKHYKPPVSMLQSQNKGCVTIQKLEDDTDEDDNPSVSAQGLQAEKPHFSGDTFVQGSMFLQFRRKNAQLAAAAAG